ncbi:MAG: hypothetical protein ACKVTZ_11810, partial [Bacteroidia bacterium]
MLKEHCGTHLDYLFNNSLYLRAFNFISSDFMQKSSILFIVLYFFAIMSQAQTVRKSIYTLQEGETLKGAETGLLVSSDVLGNYALLIEAQKGDEIQTYFQTAKGKLGPIFSNPSVRNIYDENQKTTAMVIESREWREPNAFVLYPNGSVIEGKGVANFEVSPNGENYLKITRNLDNEGMVKTTQIEEKGKKAITFNGNIYVNLNNEGWIAYSEPDGENVSKEIYVSSGKKFTKLTNLSVYVPLKNGGYILGHDKDSSLIININDTEKAFKKQDGFEPYFTGNEKAQDNFMVVLRAYQNEEELFQVKTFKGYTSPIYRHVATNSVFYDVQKETYYWIAREIDNNKEVFLCDDKGNKTAFPIAVDDYEYYPYTSANNESGFIQYKLVGDNDGEVMQVIDYQKGKAKGRVIKGITDATVTIHGDILKKQIVEGDSFSYEYKFPNNNRLTLREDLNYFQLSESGE